jgi:hypothetical protein
MRKNAGFKNYRHSVRSAQIKIEHEMCREYLEKNVDITFYYIIFSRSVMSVTDARFEVFTALKTRLLGCDAV